MNTTEIIHVLKKNPVTKNFFDGIYPVDHLDKITDRPKLIICNTDTSNGKGLHWIVIFFSQNNQVDFFDSLGRRPCDYDPRFLKFMKSFADECNYTITRTQPVNSDMCGHYCIYFSHKRCQGLLFKNILSTMPDPNIIKLFSEKYLQDNSNHESKLCQNCIKN